MNNLTVFNKEVIPVYTTEAGKKIVLGRELHERLKIGTEYTKWIERMSEYGFAGEIDYWSFLTNRSDGLAGKPKTDHYLSLEMSKHLAMIQRTPEGKAIRDKLIALETAVSELSPQLQLLINMELRQKQLEIQNQEIAESQKVLDTKIEDIRDVVALNPHDWREDSSKIINRIAQNLGGTEHIRDVRSDIYESLESRYGVSLKIRLTNKRRRMADEGICKSKRDKLNNLDVIAEDKKLIEGYVAILKEMAVKTGTQIPDSLTA